MYIPQVYDGDPHTLPQQNPLVVQRICEVVHQCEHILGKVSVILLGIVVLGVVHSHGSLSDCPLLWEALI